MVLLLVLLLTLCTSFDAKSMRAFQDANDSLEQLAKQVANAVLSDSDEEEPETKKPEQEQEEKEQVPVHQPVHTPGVQAANIPNYNCPTLLYIISWHHIEPLAHSDLVKYLASGHPVDVCDAYGSTALHMAVFYRDIRAIKLLLKYGAKWDFPNQYNQTARDLAGLSNNKEIKKLFRII